MFGRHRVGVYCGSMKRDHHPGSSSPAPEPVPEQESGPEPGPVNDALRRLPPVDKVLRSPAVAALLATGPRWAVLAAVRAELTLLRQRVLAGNTGPVDGEGRWAVAAEPIAARVADLVRPTLRRVINATGVVLHTNLGRAPLAAAALARAQELCAGYCNLEYQLEEGRRGSRQDLLESLLAPLTGAEAHLVVNNNAAAVLLMLSGLCAGGEVVVSRGELVEIGGSFRVPDVMRASGALLREVGTTNRTHRSDYAAAIGENTRALLKVHRGNFAIVGFVAEVRAAQLAQLAHEQGLLCLYDLGSGALTGLPGAVPGHASSPWDGESEDAAAAEPTVPEAVAAGCDVVAFSGDKLLGGPQAGILAGRRAVLDRLRKHPLLRAVRPDKLTLATLLATLELYRDGYDAQLPTRRLLAAEPAELRARAGRLQQLCMEAGIPAAVVATRSAVGGGAMPLQGLPSFAVALPAGETMDDNDGLARRLDAALRRGAPAVVARIEAGRLLCDVRTLLDEDELTQLGGALRKAWPACSAHRDRPAAAAPRDSSKMAARPDLTNPIANADKEPS